MRPPAFLLCLASLAFLSSAQAVNPRDRDFWNGKFNDPKSNFNRQPSKFLTEAVAGRHPGLAIDPGMGEGRNAIYLAQQGWKVTGVDLSDIAIAQAKKHAAALGVSLDAVIDDLDRYDFGRDRWDLIALFYMHAWYHGSKPNSVERLQAASSQAA